MAAAFNAIEPNNDIPSTGATTALQFRKNFAIQKRLAAYKTANGCDLAYYRRIIKDAPERVVDILLYRDMQRHEADMQSVAKQLPHAQEFYDKQTPEVKRLIQQRLSEVNPYYKDKAFVSEVSREMGRQDRLRQSKPRSPRIAAP